MAPVTTYVRQHGPPPRKLSSQAPAAKQQPPPTHQPVRSAAYSAGGGSKTQSASDPWDATSADANKWRPPVSSSQEEAPAPQPTPTPSSSSPKAEPYVRMYGPPRRSLATDNDAEGQEDRGTSPGRSRAGHGGHGIGRDSTDSGGAEGPSRSFRGAWGGSDAQGRGSKTGESGAGDRPVPSGGRWKEPPTPPAPAPMNTRWKEPKEELSGLGTGSKWRSRDDSGAAAVGGGGARWSRGLGETEGERAPDTRQASDGLPSSAPLPLSTVLSATPALVTSTTWKDPAMGKWQPESDGVREEASAVIGPYFKTPEPEKAQVSKSMEPTSAASMEDVTASTSSAAVTVGTTTPSLVSGGPADVPSSYVSPFNQSAAPLPRTTSWEPQLPRAGEHTWSAPSHGHESQGDGQGQGQGGSSTQAAPWGDPWGTSGFSVPTDGDGSSGGMASFLPSEHRKDRYLPPALRNRASSQESQGDTAPTMPTTEATPAPTSSKVTAETHQEMLLPGTVTVAGVGAGLDVGGSPHFDQQQQQTIHNWQEDQQKAQQHTHQQAQEQAQRVQAVLPIEQPLHQQQSPNPPQQQKQFQQQSQAQLQVPQHMQLRDQRAHQDQEFRPESVSAPQSFQQQDQHQHQVQEQVQRHRFQPEHFRHQHFQHSQHQTLQDQVLHSPMQDHLQHHQFHPDHPPRQVGQPQHQQHLMHQHQTQYQHHHPHQQIPQLPPAQHQMGQPQQQQQQLVHQHQHQQFHQQQQHHHQTMAPQQQMTSPLPQQPQLAQPGFLMQATGYSEPTSGGLGGFVHMSNYPGDLPPTPPPARQGRPHGPYGYHKG
ncbi:unnamed protein product [Discosporangium mesarthrocarpum]